MKQFLVIQKTKGHRCEGHHHYISKVQADNFETAMMMSGVGESITDQVWESEGKVSFDQIQRWDTYTAYEITDELIADRFITYEKAVFDEAVIQEKLARKVYQEEQAKEKLAKLSELQSLADELGMDITPKQK